MPFEIPESWEWACFGDISEVVRGGSPRPAGSVEFYNGNIPFLKVADLTNDNGVYVYSAENSIKEAGLTKTRFVKAGTLLLTNSGATLGVPKITNIDTTFNDGIAAFLYLDNSIKLYSYWYLRSQTNNLRAINQGAGQPNLNTDLIKNLIIPLPPVAEQARIVSAIENMFLLLDYIENDKRALNDSIHVLKSKILDYAINGKLVPQNPNDTPAIELLRAVHHYIQPCDTSHYENIPSQWQVVPMCFLCTLTDGEKQNGIERVYLDVKYLRGKGERIMMSAGKYVLENSTMILVDGENSGEIFTNQIAGYQGSTFKLLNISNEMYKPFILYIIKSYQTQFRENKVGSAIPHLNKKLFREIEVLVPPFEEQKRIVNKIDEIFQRIDTIYAEL